MHRGHSLTQKKNWSKNPWPPCRLFTWIMIHFCLSPPSKLLSVEVIFQKMFLICDLCLEDVFVFVKAKQRKKEKEGECLLNYHDFLTIWILRLPSFFFCFLAMFLFLYDLWLQKNVAASEIHSSFCFVLGLREDIFVLLTRKRTRENERI